MRANRESAKVLLGMLNQLKKEVDEAIAINPMGSMGDRLRTTSQYAKLYLWRSTTPNHHRYRELSRAIDECDKITKLRGLKRFVQGVDITSKIGDLAQSLRDTLQMFMVSMKEFKAPGVHISILRC